MHTDRQPILSEISRRRKLNLLPEHLALPASVLEVGAGSGWFSEQLGNKGYDVTRLDMIGPADIVGNINSWMDLGIKEDSFDAVVALEVIEHVDCLQSLKSICKTGGLIMLSSPHPNWDWVMRILEFFRLTQIRTSPHTNLTKFSTIDMPIVVSQRPLGIHQVAIFRNL